MKYSGTNMLNTLRKFADEKDLDSFLDYLISAMELGTPTLGEINSIVEICDGLDNTPLIQDVLEASLLLYPGDPELMTKLAKLYARRPATRPQAMEMVNSAIGLKRGSDGKYCTVDISKLSHNNLARFLDTYLNMEAYEGLIEALQFLLTNGAEAERDMLVRNMFNAYTRLGKLAEAAALLPELEAQHLVGEHIHFQLGQEVLRVAVLLVFQQAADPGELFLVAFAQAAGAGFVLPVRGNAVFGHAVHIPGADLHFKGDGF